MWGRRVRVAAVTIASALLSCARPPTAAIKFAPAGMNPTGRYTASAAGDVTFWGNGALHLHLYMEKGPLVVTLRAGGNVVDGEAPRISITVDGRPIETLDIDSSQVREYTVSARLDHTGTKLLEIVFGNHVAKPNPLAGRTLYVQTVTVRQGV